MFGLKISNIVTTTISAPFSLIRYAIKHPLQAVITALFVSNLPSIRATQATLDGANDQGTCGRLLGGCHPLFDEMAERTIPCTVANLIDELAFEGLPLNRFVLEKRPQWADVGWEECMKMTDSILAEDGHEHGAYFLWYQRAEILHAKAQIKEVWGNFTRAADQYSTALYWLHDAPGDWPMTRDPMTAAQMKSHLDAQKYVALLQALTCEKPDEIEKAKEMLLWTKNKGYFDYESPVDLLSLAFLSYENGDCPQVKKLLELTEKLEARGMVDLSQYVTMGDSCREKWTPFRSGNGPIFSATDPTGDSLTARSMLKWLQVRIDFSSSRRRFLPSI
jgi:hypothetical protein